MVRPCCCRERGRCAARVGRRCRGPEGRGDGHRACEAARGREIAARRFDAAAPGPGACLCCRHGVSPVGQLARDGYRRHGRPVAVTADPEVERCLRGQPVHLLRDVGSGLLPAVRAGCRVVIEGRGGRSSGRPSVPFLPRGDASPAARTARGGAFVPDRPRTGTTCVVWPPDRPMVAQDEPGSAAKHRAPGLRCLDDAPPGARHDVVTLADLRAAVTHGLSARNAAQVASLDRLEPASATA